MPQQRVDRSLDRRDCSTVVSILPVMIDDTKPGLIPSQYIIPAVKDPMKDFEILNVFRARFPVYLDENRPALIIPAPSDTVAESIVRDYKGAAANVENEVAEPGLFWIPGFVTKETVELDFAKELQHARMLQLEWFRRLVELGDDDWNRYRMRRMISTTQKLALRILGEEREWGIIGDSRIESSTIPCKFCRAPIHPEAIVCSNCTGILDVSKAKELGYIKASE